MNEKVLDPEILDGIKSFSGTPDEMAPTERLISEGHALQRTQTQYTTAITVQEPRSFTRFVNNCMEEAKLAGSAFYYRWEVFDKKKGRKIPIEGEAIDMSMCLARNFGNDVIDIEVTETVSHYLFKGVFIDLETGFTAPRLFRQRKGQNISGKMDADRQEDIVFQIGQSKAIRNAIVRAMPKWLRDQMIETAKEAELGKIKPENIHNARAKVMDFFGKYDVTQDRIENERLKKADDWDAQDIVDLRGMATALKEGRVSADELFSITGPEPASREVTPPPTNGEKSLFETLKGMRPSTSDKSRIEFERIINEKADEIKEWKKTFPVQFNHISDKWTKNCPNIPFPARKEDKDGAPDLSIFGDRGVYCDRDQSARSVDVCEKECDEVTSCSAYEKWAKGDVKAYMNGEGISDEVWHRDMTEYLEKVLGLATVLRILRLKPFEYKNLNEVPVERREDVLRAMKEEADKK